MKFFVDTADTADIADLAATGLLDGVTTNPSLIAKAGRDFIEVTREIKGNERTKHIPIVVMTSSNEESDIAECYKLGANSYIVKPLDFASLAEVARQAGYYWLVVNRGPV